MLLKKIKIAMKIIFRMATTILFSTGCFLMETMGCPEKKTAKSKPVILIAAFGSSMSTGEKNLADTYKMLKKKFPKNEIRWAFTSQTIINKLKKKGKTTYFDCKIPIKNLSEVYDDLINEGKVNIAVQCLYVIAGTEFGQVLRTQSKGLNVKYGYPLLFDPENIKKMIIALSENFGDPSDTATIVCAHGNKTHPENNAHLIQMDKYLRNNYKNTFLASLEGSPEFINVLQDISRSGVTNARFVPLMLTYGDHMINDVMGDEPNSWKMQIGLPATVSDSMGSNPKIIKMFIKEINLVLSRF
ncbi:MAG: sirohydrochlorin cobaltochelatase [Actinomycetota bacterium]|nr:sirohydrochlorin cobaltochelatase [Actinomycetota bacterium]